jgi:transposase
LQCRDLVLEPAAAEAEGRGRPPTLLGLNARAGAAVGVAFGHERLHVAVADLSSTVPAEAKLGLDVDASADAERDLRGPLSKQGPRYLRWALVEAATHACTAPVYRDRYQQTKARIGKQRGAKVAQNDLARCCATSRWTPRSAAL